ncbi:MAG TPA: hypothetical protein VFN14_06845 [Candidatus Limnocylindria bacterium]|nr:hypothetical protein [Candidatus Limnocylindria bacterium]
MDRRDIELQIRIIRLTYRREARDHRSRTLDDFRRRAKEIIDGIAPLEPDLERELDDLRREIGLLED